MPVPVLLMAREMNLGGVERDVSKFARHLCAYGIAPHVASFSPSGMRWREVEAAGIPLLPLPVASFRSRSGLAGAWNLRRYLREHRIQVFHAFDQASAVFGVPVARVAGVPVAISSQLCYRELVPPNLRLLLPALDRIATALFVNCEAMADHLVRDCGVPRSKIRVCYNGVETDEFHPRGRVRPESLAPARVVIGTVAVLREEKNLPLPGTAGAGPGSCGRLRLRGSHGCPRPLDAGHRHLRSALPLGGLFQRPARGHGLRLLPGRFAGRRYTRTDPPWRAGIPL